METESTQQFNLDQLRGGNICSEVSGYGAFKSRTIREDKPLLVPLQGN